MAEYEKPLPRAEDPALTQPFWDATKRHELVIPHCSKCNQYFWYPRQACPNCLQEDWEWTPVSGKASLHTFTVVRQAQNPPSPTIFRTPSPWFGWTKACR